MQEGVEERKQSEHAPVLNDPVPSRQTPHGGHGQRQDQEAQRPDAGLRLERFGGVGAQEVVEKAVRQIRGRNQGRNEKQDFPKALHGVDQ